MIIQGDCLEVMKAFPDNHFSCVVTDPPYGLKFMNKKWDSGVPDKAYWQEVLRVTKPGGHILAFGGSRTYHRLACAIEDAGWEIRDCIMWIFGSGFTKSHNHFGLAGYGTALKPAYEPIIVAMKPLDGTFKQNAEKWGVAGINVDACRVEGSWTRSTTTMNNIKGGAYNTSKDVVFRDPQESSPLGRWPANVILDEGAGILLDEQSGVSKSRPEKRSGSDPKKGGVNCYSGGWGHSPSSLNDSGGASRFFYCAKSSPKERGAGLEELPYKIGGGVCSTISGDTRTGHITVQKNNHPTVKPLKLMEYLIKLVMPPESGLLLDPFAGSGSTIVAAKKLGFEAVGIEMSEEYCKIANARIDFASLESIKGVAAENWDSDLTNKACVEEAKKDQDLFEAI